MSQYLLQHSCYHKSGEKIVAGVIRKNMVVNGEKARWKNTGSPDTRAKAESGKERDGWTDRQNTAVQKRQTWCATKICCTSCLSFRQHSSYSNSLQDVYRISNVPYTIWFIFIEIHKWLCPFSQRLPNLAAIFSTGTMPFQTDRIGGSI